MANASTDGVEIGSVFCGEAFDRVVFLEIGLVMILNVMVEGKDELLGIEDSLGADCLELANHGRGVVMCHHMKRTNRDKVAGTNGAIGPIDQMGLSNFLDNRLRHETSWHREYVRLNLTYASEILLLFDTLFRDRTVILAFVRSLLRISVSISAIKSLTEPIRSRLHTASLTRFCAGFESTPSASAENFSSIS